MPKTGGINPGQFLPQSKPDVHGAEKAKVKTEQGKALSSADAARLASQAGFQRLRKKGAHKGLDIGDSSAAPIPLPGDDVDAESWSQERLDSAQGSMALANAQFGEIADADGAEASIGATLVGSSFMPIEDDITEMEDLAARPPPKPLPMLDEMSNSVSQLFGIELPAETPVGHRVLAAGLLVAGEKDAVQVKEKALDERDLAGGIKKVSERSNQAVGEAQKMSKGINRELNLQRTMFKR